MGREFFHFFQIPNKSFTAASQSVQCSVQNYKNFEPNERLRFYIQDLACLNYRLRLLWIPIYTRDLDMLCLSAIPVSNNSLAPLIFFILTGQTKCLSSNFIF